MALNLSVASTTCATDAHYTSPDGRLRCNGIQHRLTLRWADSVVCPWCATHFTPARGAAAVHIRACAKRRKPQLAN